MDPNPQAAIPVQRVPNRGFQCSAAKNRTVPQRPPHMQTQAVTASLAAPSGVSSAPQAR